MITSITTNLKSETGEQRTFPLAQRTLICGPSASGKSAIVNALELSTAKRMTDYLGRGDASERTVQDLLTAGDVELLTTVERTNVEAPVALPYQSALYAILSNPTTAHLSLLGNRLSPETRGLARELGTVEKQRKTLKESIEHAEMLQEYLKGELTMESTAAQVKLLDREVAEEAELMGLDAKVKGLKEAVAMGVRAAWTPEILAEVTSYIPAGLGAFAIFTAGDALQLRLGLSRNGAAGVRWALSGSEWNIVVTALAHLEVQDDTYCVIPADRAIDAALLQAWMRTLSKSKGQILLTAIDAPRNIPSGWEVLYVGAKPKLKAPSKAPSKAASAGKRASGRATVARKPGQGVRAGSRGKTAHGARAGR